MWQSYLTHLFLRGYKMEISKIVDNAPLLRKRQMFFNVKRRMYKE